MFAIALLCALAFAPAALHARICLVTLGVVADPGCCEPRACCTPAPDNGPALSAVDPDCRCCLMVDFDSSEKTPLDSATLRSAPLLSACPRPPEIVFAPAPPGAAIATSCFARAGPRPRWSAPIPLRI